MQHRIRLGSPTCGPNLGPHLFDPRAQRLEPFGLLDPALREAVEPGRDVGDGGGSGRPERVDRQTLDPLGKLRHAVAELGVTHRTRGQLLELPRERGDGLAERGIAGRPQFELGQPLTEAPERGQRLVEAAALGLPLGGDSLELGANLGDRVAQPGAVRSRFVDSGRKSGQCILEALGAARSLGEHADRLDRAGELLEAIGDPGVRDRPLDELVHPRRELVDSNRQPFVADGSRGELLELRAEVGELLADVEPGKGAGELLDPLRERLGTRRVGDGSSCEILDDFAKRRELFDRRNGRTRREPVDPGRELLDPCDDRIQGVGCEPGVDPLRKRVERSLQPSHLFGRGAERGERLRRREPGKSGFDLVCPPDSRLELRKKGRVDLDGLGKGGLDRGEPCGELRLARGELGLRRLRPVGDACRPNGLLERTHGELQIVYLRVSTLVATVRRRQDQRRAVAPLVGEGARKLQAGHGAHLDENRPDGLTGRAAAFSRLGERLLVDDVGCEEDRADVDPTRDPPTSRLSGPRAGGRTAWQRPHRERLRACADAPGPPQAGSTIRAHTRRGGSLPPLRR